MGSAMVTRVAEASENECAYGCDAFGPDGTCSGCTGLLQRNDGSVINIYTREVVKKRPLRLRIRDAIAVLWYSTARSLETLAGRK